MRLHKNSTDLTKINGTIGKLFLDHYEQLMAVHSSNEAYELVNNLFTASDINTPKSREILFKLHRGMSYTKTLEYLANIYLNAKGLGTMTCRR